MGAGRTGEAWKEAMAHAVLGGDAGPRGLLPSVETTRSTSAVAAKTMSLAADTVADAMLSVTIRLRSAAGSAQDGYGVIVILALG